MSEPKQGSEEPDYEAALTEVFNRAPIKGEEHLMVPKVAYLALRAEVERLKAILPPGGRDAGGPFVGERSWSVFAEKVVEERDALRAQLAQAREEIKQRRDELRSLDMRLTVERAAREREKSHFAEQWTLEEARFMGMLHRAEQAEATVRNLENAIIDWETEPQYRVTNLNRLHSIAKDTILARAKEGEHRG